MNSLVCPDCGDFYCEDSPCLCSPTPDAAKDSQGGYVVVHRCEELTLKHQPSIGMTDLSECLPSWVKTFCEKHEQGEGYTMSPAAVTALTHTLIAARVRCHRLIEERDTARDMLAGDESLKDQP